jgi:hypothetical protein
MKKNIKTGSGILTADQEQVLRRLFPEGVDKTRVWNDFIVPLSLAKGRFEKVIESLKMRMRLRGRILKKFPCPADRVLIKESGDIGIMRKITTTVYGGEGMHLLTTHSTVVLHGNNYKDMELDYATQAALSILIKFVDSSLFKKDVVH